MPTEFEQAKNIVANSGNSFHSTCIGALRKAGWSVLISPYYQDRVTQKPREIDLIAERAFPVLDDWAKQKGTLIVQLFVECKFIKQTTVFWFHEQDRQATEDVLVNSTPLRRRNIYTQQHHYLKDSNGLVAKLFAGQPNVQTEGEQFYKALNQSLNAMIANTGRETILPIDSRSAARILATVRYPVILCDSFDRAFRVNIESSDDDPAAIDSNFKLEVNYAYSDSSGRPSNAFFLIDIVNFHNLSSYLDAVNSDVEAMQIVLND